MHLRFLLILATFMTVGSLAASGVTEERSQEAQTVIKVGIIGLDTSHVVQFTQLLNDELRPDHVPGARVVAAFKGGSPDVEASATRIEKFTAELKDRWGVKSST